MKFLRYALARLAEPSTYAGIAAVLAVAGWQLDPGTMQMIVNAGTGLSGLAAIALRG